MDTQRLILFFVFVFSTFMLVDGWQRDQRPQISATQPAAKTAGGVKGVDKGSAGESPVPVAPASSAGSAPPASAAASVPAANDGSGGETVKVETDTLLVEISTKGGTIRRLELKQHKGTFDKTKNFVLFQRDAEHTYIAQSGLSKVEGLTLPDHNTVYTVASREFKLADSAQTLEVRLDAPEAAGVKAAQIFKFTRGSYLVDVAYDITNGSDKALQPFGYFQLIRDRKPPEGGSAMMPTFTGLAVYTDATKYQKVAFDDIDKGKAPPYPKTSQADGWVAMVQHYFVSAYVPKDKAQREFSTFRLDNGTYVGRVVVAGNEIQPGKLGRVSAELYAGPQDTRTLEKVAPGLDVVVDYGWLKPIAVPLFMVLSWIHGWVGNWGIAIILLTVLLKAMFYPLQEASYKAMAKMKVIAPKMQQLKERYGDDRQRMQKAMMELYQKEKVNPMAGCLPIIVQMPVFIALYWTILASVELRYAPFGLGISDLAMGAISTVPNGVAVSGVVVGSWLLAPLPYWALPILMGASMIIQTRLNPEPPDPVQAKVMKIMPIAFSIFFFFFPAGLVLYWLVNNILSIAQQWHINRVIDRGNQKPAKA